MFSPRSFGGIACLVLLAPFASRAAAQDPLPPMPPVPPPVEKPAAPDAADAAPTWKPVVGQPAPEVACATWITEPGAKGVTTTTTVTNVGGVPVSRRARTLAELADHVVIVHTFAWDDRAARDVALPLVRDLLSANGDRKLTAIGIGSAIEVADARSSAKSLQLEHPIALEKLNESRSPYVDLRAHAACWAFVVGRGGGLEWQGNPAQDEKGFLNAVREALDRHPVGRLDRRLHERLGKALAEYYDGKLSRAIASAQDERKAAEKSNDRTLSEDAQVLERAARETQLAWLREVGDAATRHDATAYVALVQACKVGLARGDVQKDLDRLEKDVHKDGLFEMRLLESQKYLDMLADRPVTFPVRKDAAGDKFAQRLEAFLRATNNSTDETRTARSLVDRYRLTAR